MSAVFIGRHGCMCMYLENKGIGVPPDKHRLLDLTAEYINPPFQPQF